MTDSSTTTDTQTHKPYNFILGALASFLAIPITTLGTIIVGQVGFEYPAIFSGVGMVLAFSFFGAASHRRVVRGVGFLLALVMGLVATTLAFASGFISGVFYSFNSVGGKGGLLGEVFIGRVVFRLTDRPEEFIIPAVAVVVLVLILLGKYLKEAISARRLERTASSAPTVPELDGTTGEHSSDAVAAHTFNAPSSGILLNGKPVGGSEPKKRLWR